MAKPITPMPIQPIRVSEVEIGVGYGVPMVMLLRETDTQ